MKLSVLSHLDDVFHLFHVLDILLFNTKLTYSSTWLQQADESDLDSNSTLWLFPSLLPRWKFLHLNNSIIRALQVGPPPPPPAFAPSHISFAHKFVISFWRQISLKMQTHIAVVSRFCLHCNALMKDNIVSKQEVSQGPTDLLSLKGY